MELSELNKLADQYIITDITAVKYYTDNQEELAKLTKKDLVDMGLICQIAAAQENKDDSSTEPGEVEEKVTITFTTVPEEAKVEIGGVVIDSKSYEIKKGETVNYVVKCEGYTEKSGSVIADSSKTESITLDAINIPAADDTKTEEETGGEKVEDTDKPKEVSKAKK